MWSYIKSKNNESTGISDLFHENKLIQDPVKKANIFNNHFCQVFSKPDSNKKPTSIKENKNSIPNITVKSAGVLKLLLNINVNKATGPDGIPGRLLNLCAYEIVDVLTLFFQASLDQGTVPKDWKQANIVPLHKKGDKSVVLNYRPISLTPITSKLLEHIVHSNIITFLDNESILNNVQHGFRKNRSCKTQLITTTRDFANCLNNKKQIDTVLLDFSKAFDKVDHTKLSDKLHAYGIRNNLHQWVSSFLLGRQPAVCPG